MVETIYGDDCGCVDGTLITNFGNGTKTEASFAAKLGIPAKPTAVP